MGQNPQAFRRASWRATRNQQTRRPPEVANLLLGTPLQKPSGFSKGRSTDTGPCPRAFHPGRYIAFRINNRTVHTATQVTNRRAQNNLVARRAGTSARSRTNALSAASAAATARMSAAASTARYEPSITTAHYGE